MHILANSDNLSISRHIHRHIQNLVVTLAHLEPWHIQYQKYSQIRGIFRTLAYSEPCQTSTMGRFRENSRNYFHNINFSKVFLIWCKVLGPKTPRAGGHEFLIHLFVDVSKEISIFGVELQPFTKYLRLTLVSMWNSALWGKFNFCFSTVFC